MLQPLLQINNLSVQFSSNNIVTNALQNINITVHKGEIVAIVGESGSGKSVTSLSILQLIPSPPIIYGNGEILLHDKNGIADILKMPQKQLTSIRGNKVAMIFQEPMSSLNPVITCGKQIMEAILLHKKISTQQAKQEAIDLLKKVQLPNADLVFEKYPHELSGGQKQRVMIAIAMSCEPELLICDEPTTALDVTVQKSILHLIKQLQVQNNMGVIFITHDLGIVAEIADKVMVMYKGKIVEENTTKQLFTNPKHAYTKALLACRPLLSTTKKRLPVVSDFLEVNNDGTIIEKDNAKTINDNAFVQNSCNYNNVLLSVKNLKIYYPTKTNFWGKPINFVKAVNNISFDVYKGETLGLVGESGCGKSTLGKAINRLIEPTSGEIIFNNINVTKASAKVLQSVRKDVQIIFQDPFSSLNPKITIGNAIAEPLLVHKIVQNKKQAIEVVKNLLDKVNLNPSFFNRYPHEFSGGQRQRIVIARTLALQPKFVICDESVSALDVSVQAQILNLLNDLKKEFDFTAIFISHDLAVVKYISDRIMVMQQGKIEEIGNAEDIYQFPKSDYTKKLLSSIPTISF